VDSDQKKTALQIKAGMEYNRLKRSPIAQESKLNLQEILEVL